MNGKPYVLFLLNYYRKKLRLSDDTRILRAYYGHTTVTLFPNIDGTKVLWHRSGYIPGFVANVIGAIYRLSAKTHGTP